jgi:hypothetical protein
MTLAYGIGALIGVWTMAMLLALAMRGPARPAPADTVRAVDRSLAVVRRTPGTPVATRAVSDLTVLWPYLEGRGAGRRQVLIAALHAHLERQLTTGAAPVSLHDTAACLRVGEVFDDLPPTLVHELRDQLAHDRIPPTARDMLVILAATLGLTAAWAGYRLARGPQPVDPQAETLENVEPIDIDTQSITLDGKRTTTSEATLPSPTTPVERDLGA